MELPTNFKDTEAIKLLEKLNILWYIASLAEHWIRGVKLPTTFQRIYNPYMKVLHYVMVAFVLATLGAFFTQHNLTPDQEHTMVFGLASCLVLIYRLVLSHYKNDIRMILYHLTVTLKEYNNSEVEQRMLKKIKWYMNLYISTSLVSILLRGLKAAIQVYKGEHFITFIAMWPDVTDPAPIAEVARYITYLMWFIILLQCIGTLLMVMTIMIIISHQYENLASYFDELDELFEDNQKSQEAKEKEFEEGLLKAFSWHATTLWCVQRFQYVCRIIFNLHLTLTPLILVYVLPEMVNPEYTTAEKMEQVPLFMTMLMFLGFFMWNAGDITVEAAKLPDAMFATGWKQCRGNTKVRTVKMIVFAMQQAQKPVVLTAFGTFELSYESFVKIVKATYSFFSVLAM